MRCPKCGNDMLEDASSTEIFHCLRCQGIWQRQGQLEEFLRASATARGVVLDAIGLVESPPRATSIKCPDCPMRYLEALHYRGVEVDRCPGCRGVYADADEREKIAQRVLNAKTGWEKALREWERHGQRRRRSARAETDANDASYLGMAIVAAYDISMD